jgi:hypothetical protein
MASGGDTLPEGFQLVSNNVDNFVDSGLGPDQADVKMRFEYFSQDYGGTMANDPVLGVRAVCTPIDGSNENKEFEATWAVGPKMSDCFIFADGGKVGRKSTDHLSTKSVWASFQRSLKDIDPMLSKLTDGPKGIKELDGIELTLKKIPTPALDGTENKNAKGFTRMHYTALKLIAAPGETKRAGHKARPVAASTTGTASAASKATMGQPVNGNGSGSADVVELIKQALTNANGSIPLKGASGLAKAVFLLAKNAGHSVGESNTFGTQASNENFLIEQSMEHDLGWNIEGGVLTQTPA